MPASLPSAGEPVDGCRREDVADLEAHRRGYCRGVASPGAATKLAEAGLALGRRGLA